jgi:hypothetical protein
MYDSCGGQAYSLSGSTGTMAAALAANAIVFAMQATGDVAGSVNAPRRAPIEIEAMRMTFTAIVAATTPVTAGRVLQLFKSSSNASTLPAGGTLLAALAKRGLDAGADSGLVGARIATTAGLTVVGFTRGTVPLATLDLTGLGAAGSRLEWNFSEQVNGAAIWLDPGEILVVSNPAAIDAALTWQLSVDVDYRRRDSL